MRICILDGKRLLFTRFFPAYNTIFFLKFLNQTLLNRVGEDKVISWTTPTTPTPQFNILKMEDNLILFENGRRPQFFEN
jgi:hypothetical protein